MEKSDTHPLPAGTPVVVISAAARRSPFIEGRARIVCPFGEEPHVYVIQFEHEALPQVRVVLPEWQRHPAQTIHEPKSGSRSMPAATLPRALQLALLPPGGNKLAGRRRGER